MLCIRKAELKDLPSMLEIYNDAIRNLTATFDLIEQTLEERKVWFDHHTDRYPLLVAELDGQVVGYCCLSPFREKPAYARTTELSIYLSSTHRGSGIGSALMTQIICLAKESGFHTMIGGITAGNEASVKLHEKFGFVRVGCLKQVGYKFDAWQDVYYYQLMVSE